MSRRAVIGLAVIVGWMISQPGLASATTQTFTNPTPITIPSGSPTTTQGPATPYPSNIIAAGFLNPLVDVSVTLNNLSHTFPDDLDILLVGPGGQRFIIMSDAGGDPNVVNVSLTLADSAPSLLPDGTQITSGAFKPTNYETGDTFPAPAPAGPYSSPGPVGTDTFFDVFAGIDPNGTWSLWVVDDAAVDVGTIAGGWTLAITDSSESLPEPGTLLLLGSGLIGSALMTRVRKPR